jgi:ferredoxin
MITYQDSHIDDLINVYTCLSEVLMPSVQAGLPEWLALPGKEWPLYESCVRLAKVLENPKLDQCAIAFSEVPISSLNLRSGEYEELFFGNGSPPIWLHESQFVDGRIIGSTSFSIQSIYKQAGLEIIGAELPDHAGMELAFLAYLADKEKEDIEFRSEWKKAKDLFTENHVGRWLPEVGKQISRSSYPGWSAIGSLISAIFRTSVIQQDSKNPVPSIEEPELCTLCGFCVQVCPTQALKIYEDSITSLRLKPNLCTSCANCRDICPENVLSLSVSLVRQDQISLRESPLATCPACGETTFSQAELDYTNRILGNPDWLAYCIKCRTRQIGKLS